MRGLLRASIAIVVAVSLMGDGLAAGGVTLLGAGTHQSSGGGGGGPTPVTVWDGSPALNGTDAGNGSANLMDVMFLPSSLLTSASGKTQFRLTLRTGSANAASGIVDNLYFGRANGASHLNFNGNQVRALIGGSGTLSIPGTANTDVVTDWMNFAGGEQWDSSLNYVLAFHLNSGNSAAFTGVFTQSGASIAGSFQNYYVGADEAAATTKSGSYTELGPTSFSFITKIEVQ